MSPHLPPQLPGSFGPGGQRSDHDESAAGRLTVNHRLPSGGRDEALHEMQRIIASPLAIMIGIPLLVIGVWIVTILAARGQNRQAIEQLVDQQFRDKAVAIGGTAMQPLRRADAILDQLAALTAVDDIDRAGLVAVLYELVENRPGVAYISIARPSGHVTDVHRDAEGSLFFEEYAPKKKQLQRQRWPLQNGRMTVDDPIVEMMPPVAVQDRLFYRDAVTTRRRVWTRPYRLFGLDRYGIACAEPLYDSTGELQAVVAVQYDLVSLSAVMTDLSGKDWFSDTSAFLMSDRLQLLALPFWDRVIASDDPESMLQDVNERLAALLPEPIHAYDGKTSEAAGYLVRVSHHDLDDDQGMWVVTTQPVDSLLAPINGLLAKAWYVPVIALVVAVFLALAFAANLVRYRKNLLRARKAVRAAEAAARELGSYRLVRQLGAGGMGEVWLAEHQFLAAPAAMKIVRRQSSQDDAQWQEDLERFQREARATARLSCRNTIQIFDYGTSDENSFYYVMELLDGIDLESLLGQHGYQPVDRVMSILRQIVASLAEAHAMGFVHRDIKPANVFLSRFAGECDVVKVLDFGIVHDVRGKIAKDRITARNEVVGTAGFIAPEQLTGGEPQPQADLYALGCVAWYLLCGFEVFTGDTNYDIVRSHIADPLPDLTRVCPQDLPDGLAELITALLEKKPEGRPASAVEVMQELLKIAAIGDWSREQATEWWAKNKPRRADDATTRALPVQSVAE